MAAVYAALYGDLVDDSCGDDADRSDTSSARPVTTERIEPGTNALQSAGHAVLRTLYSRAHRIWLNEASWLLRGFRKNVSSDLLLVDVVRVFAQPALELVIPLE